MSVLLETTEGNITIDLFIETQPLASFNFLKLCKVGYYFFAPFHSLDSNLTVSCGDPEYPRSFGKSITQFGELDDSILEEVLNSGKGADTVPTLNTEPFIPAPAVSKPPGVGILSYITHSHKTHKVYGSSFNITLSSDNASLQGIENVVPFGRVVEGFQVLETINNLPIESIETKRLLKDVRITYAHIIHDPFRDPDWLTEQPQQSLRPSEYQLSVQRFPSLSSGKADQPENSTSGTNEVSNNTDYNALTLELVGDLPHYKIKPAPETLFIAKLNPITTSESLKIIFSRFGNVKQSNVITHDTKGQKRNTCFGFVQFVSQNEAERAYAKLSKGCIIDGREVYVDFSQSVRARAQ